MDFYSYWKVSQECYNNADFFGFRSNLESAYKYQYKVERDDVNYDSKMIALLKQTYQLSQFIENMYLYNWEELYSAIQECGYNDDLKLLCTLVAKYYRVEKIPSGKVDSNLLDMLAHYLDRLNKYELAVELIVDYLNTGKKDIILYEFAKDIALRNRDSDLHSRLEKFSRNI